MQTGSSVVQVVPNPAGGWDVREPGNTRPLAHASDHDRAVARARSALTLGGEVEILDESGAVLHTHRVPPARSSTVRSEVVQLVVAVLIAVPALGRIMGTSAGTWLLIDWLFLAAGVATGIKCTVALVRIKKSQRAS